MNKRQSLIESSKYPTKCPHTMTPKYITIHNTANDGSAAAEIRYMKSNSKQTSFHVAVDDIESVQGIPFNRNAWHAGDGAKGTGNLQSIAVEICYSKSGGARFEKAVENAVEVVATLCKTYGIPVANIRYHKNWSGKYCPHRLLDQGVTLEKFRQRVQAKYNELYSKPAAAATGTVYQVVCGSYSSKANAQKRQQELTNKGFDSFLHAKKSEGEEMAKNTDNLKVLSPTEARKQGSKGGKASAKARRRKKELKELLELALSQPAPENPDQDNYMAIVCALVNEGKAGNTKAFEVIRDTLGQKPTEQQQLDLSAKIEVDYGED